MALWTDLKDAIDNVVKTNGNQEITGDNLQQVLFSIVDNVGGYATYKGVATPSTVPGIPDGPQFYIAEGSGLYSNFSGVNIKSKGFYIFTNDGAGSWDYIELPFFQKLVGENDSSSIYSGGLQTQDPTTLADSVENVTYNVGSSSFVSSSTRVTFLGVPIANIDGLVKLTVAAGYKAGVLFFEDRIYDELLQGFSWMTGTSEWSFPGDKANVVTVGLSKNDDSAISIAEAQAAITSFEITSRDNFLNPGAIGKLGQKIEELLLCSKTSTEDKLNFDRVGLEIGTLLNSQNNSNNNRFRTIDAVYTDEKVVITYDIASGYRFGVHSCTTDFSSGEYTHINDSGWLTGQGTFTVKDGANAIRLTVSKFNISEEQLTFEEIADNFDISLKSNKVLNQLTFGRALVSIERDLESIICKIGDLQVKDPSEIASGIANVTYNTTSKAFISSTTRVTFLGIRIANSKSKAIITVASGYKAGILFFASTDYSNLLQGFNWTEGTSEWGYTGNDAGIITVGLSKTDDSAISIAEAQAAITSFEITPQDESINREMVSYLYAIKDDLATYTKGYSGEKIDLNQNHKFDVKPLFDIDTIIDRASVGNNTLQGTAIYGDYLIQLYHSGYLGIVNWKTETLIQLILLPQTAPTMHSNNANFTDYWIAGNTDFPLLYISESQGSHRCYVYSLKLDGTVVLIQTISFTGTGYELAGYIDWFVDVPRKLLYTFGANGNSATEPMKIKEFNLPDPEGGDVVFGDVDVLREFLIPDIPIFQGSFVINTKLFAPYGFGNPNGVKVVDLLKEVAVSELVLTSEFNDEPEGVTSNENGLIISYQSGTIRQFNF